MTIQTHQGDATDKNSDLAKHRRVATILTVGGTIAFSAGCLAYWLILHDEGLSKSSTDWGTFGDFISGTAGTVIALVTLIALAYTMRLQAEELDKTRKFMKSQSEIMAQQAFDSVFFQLLETFRQTRDSVTHARGLPDGAAPFKGRKAFERIHAHFKRIEVSGGDPADYLASLRNRFLEIYSIYESELGPYFRTLYHIFKFIHNSTLTGADKTRYANIARAQLSSVELNVLFYDGLSPLGTEFKPLIEHYGILKHVSPEHLLPGDKTNPSLYRPEAFESADERARREPARPSQ